VHARYKLLDDGKVGVRNECRKANGKHDISNGTAKVADPKSNAKLRVTFFFPFAGDYWIIYLDKDYRDAVVGEPDRKYLLILGRSKDMDNATYQKILQHVAESGYDTSKLVRTKQSRGDGQQLSTRRDFPFWPNSQSSDSVSCGNFK
jgi:apolipoprotein D and lipocalin family protein